MLPEQTKRNARGAKTILICGAGIAGPTLAYWLAEYGFEPTLLERAPRLRTGGYMLDFWGLGFDVAERMRLVPVLRERGYAIDSVRFVDAEGGIRSELRASAIRRALGERFLSIPRGELARAVYEQVEARVETIFDDTVLSVHDDGGGVDVGFERGRPRRFDLLVGTDGLHSAVRRLVMGTDQRWLRYLGYCAASFVTSRYSRRDEGTYVSYGAPGRQISRYALTGDRSAFLLVFTAPETMGFHAGEIETDKRLLRHTFGRDSWVEVPEILTRLEECTDLYFDAVSQLQLRAWSAGRTVLIGDAAYCPSLLAGEGAALAMAGAYLLARELDRAAGDHAAAFVRYEGLYRPFIERKQRAARAFASSFAPKTNFGLAVRDAAVHLMKLPLIGTWMARRMFADDFTLPEPAARGEARQEALERA